ncbi:fasciclin domain-containing protein [Flavobacterium piscisymbiosum]|uniref:Fasciclin domain-containing protein n=1 Tax=Flavobacterium piscisymbiosum TaxID=2893753 RepID=A0ABS8MM65_9FLAO|nr:fasciclin domain-containing protein [Flavobacterium sp. F-30]MCC9066589.1 fasciclin domain-containing protein [Flavobacterium sp. F-30]
MKILYKLKQIALGALLLAMASSCDDTIEDVGGAQQNYNSVYGIIAANTNLATFTKAIDLAGLKSTFDKPDDFTFFIPTDAAFDAYLVKSGYVNSLGYPDITLVPVDVLREVVLSHVVKGVKKRVGYLDGVQADYLTTGELSTMANAEDADLYLLSVNVTNGVLKVNGSDKPAPGVDYYGTNGFVNVLDNVISLDPPAPVIEGVSNASPSPGEDIIVKGLNFVQVQNVKFDDKVVTFKVLSKTEIQVTVPADYGSNALVTVQTVYGVSNIATLGVRYLLYGDNFSGVASPVWDGGWGGTQDFQNTERVNRGTYSIKRTNNEGWTGMSIGFNSINVADYGYLKISVFPVKTTKLFFSIATDLPWATGFSVEVKAGEWNNLSIPFSDLKADKIGATISSLNIQEYSGEPGIVYFDDIGFL